MLIQRLQYPSKYKSALYQIYVHWVISKLLKYLLRSNRCIFKLISMLFRFMKPNLVFYLIVYKQKFWDT